MKKKLIVSGCSFTEKNYKSASLPHLDCLWPKWPELLGNKLNMDVINLGFSGAGNRYILQTLIETIERTPKDEIGLVIAAWSQSNRDDFQTHFKHEGKVAPEIYLDHYKWNNTRMHRPGDVFYWVRETCLAYITLQNICKRYNLPYLQFQMISLYEGWISGLAKTEKQVMDNLDNPDFQTRHKYEGNRKRDWFELSKLMLEYEKFIDVKNFLGWPSIRSLNGFTIEQKIMLKRTAKSWEINDDLIISKHDSHPNAKAHEKISKVIYGQLA